MKRLLITLGMVAYVWIIVLAYVRVWVPEHTSYQQRWTACMTDVRSYSQCRNRLP